MKTHRAATRAVFGVAATVLVVNEDSAQSATRASTNAIDRRLEEVKKAVR